MLALVGVHHAVIECPDHGELSRLRKVGLVEGAGGGGVFVVPAGNLGVCQVCLGAHLAGRAEVVGLEEDILEHRIVGEVAENLREDLADEAEWLLLLKAAGKGRDTLHSAMHGDKRIHRRVIVLLDVAADEAAALREADSVEAAAELRVRLDLCREHVDGCVHVHQEAIDRVGDAVVASRDAPGIGASPLSDGERDAGKTLLEARIAHAVRGDRRQGGGRTGNIRTDCYLTDDSAERAGPDLGHDHLRCTLGQVREVQHVRPKFGRGTSAEQSNRKTEHGYCVGGCHRTVS
mmetsp:Transcript_160765/g.515976  ORF Transcript_160765/g.515976 Transcript_160765/m.515976 type:complete len:291 (+) Transcript_160765:472-1344(+)